MVTPRDPEAFRVKVLRRAVQIERRRRRARMLLVVPAIGAGALAGVVAVQSGARTPDTVSAAGQPAGITTEEVDLPDGAEPWSLVVGSDGAVWVLVRGDRTALVRIGDDGARSTIDLPDGAAPDGVVAGTDGGIWATDPAGSRVLRVDADGSVADWPTESPPSSSSTWMGGRLWFAEPARDRVTGMTADGDVVHGDLPPGRAPTIVTTGPDGSVWYASSTTARIGSVSAGGAVNELDLAAADERAVAMASGPGPALWLVVQSPTHTQLAHVGSQGAVIADDLVVAEPPRAISIGPDGRIWLSAGDGTVQRHSAARVTTSPLGRPLRADAWALSPDDSMWAVDRDARLLLRVTID